MPPPRLSIALPSLHGRLRLSRMLPRGMLGGEPGLPYPSAPWSVPLPLRLIEMPEIGRRLARTARLQLAVDPDVVGLPFEEDIVVVLGAAVLDPVWIARA